MRVQVRCSFATDLVIIRSLIPSFSHYVLTEGNSLNASGESYHAAALTHAHLEQLEGAGFIILVK